MPELLRKGQSGQNKVSSVVDTAPILLSFEYLADLVQMSWPN
jgi:hypothetical protein